MKRPPDYFQRLAIYRFGGFQNNISSTYRARKLTTILNTFATTTSTDFPLKNILKGCVCQRAFTKFCIEDEARIYSAAHTILFTAIHLPETRAKPNNNGRTPRTKSQQHYEEKEARKEKERKKIAQRLKHPIALRIMIINKKRPPDY